MAGKAAHFMVIRKEGERRKGVMGKSRAHPPVTCNHTLHSHYFPMPFSHDPFAGLS